MTDDERIADLLLTWEEAREQGHPVSAEALCCDLPELLGVVKERIRLLESAGWMKPAVSSPTSPRILAGRYALESLIGEGGYGQVWRAYDPQLQRHVAVKIPKPSRLVRPEQIDQLLTEARRVARLQHPGIVRVIDVQAEGSAYFIVADLIEGSNLAERLRQGRPGVEESVRIVAQVARILDYAHGEGVIHRDIKPANVLLDRDGTPHVCDFGIAADQRELLDGSDRRATLAYASPEQLEGKPLDGRSDIWSLGVVLYEMLTGRLPFCDEHPVQFKEKITRDEMPNLTGIPKPLAAICLRCLEKNPVDRFKSGNHLAESLEGTLRSKTPKWMVFSICLLLFGVLILAANRFPVWPQPFATSDMANSVVGEIHCLQVPRQISSVAFSPDGRYVVTGDLGCIMRLWDIESGREIRQIIGHTNWVRTIAFTLNGQYVISGSGGTNNERGLPSVGDDNTIRVWEVETGKEIRRIGGNELPIMSVSLSSDGEELLSTGADGIVRLWNWRIGAEKIQFRASATHVCNAKFVPGRRQAVTSDSHGTISLWDLETGKQLQVFDGHNTVVDQIAVAGSGKWLVSGSRDRTVRFWDMATKRELWRFDEDTDGVTSVAFSPDGRTLLTGDLNGTIRLLSATTGRELHRFTGHGKGELRLAFSPDGRKAASASGDQTLRIWALPR